MKKLAYLLLVAGFLYGTYVAALDEKVEHLALIIDSAPQPEFSATNLDDHLVEVPAPAARSHPFDPALPDLGRKHWPEALPPEPDRFMADLNAALMQQILDVAERQRETDVQHHRQADDLGTGFEPLEWTVFGHWQTLASTRPRLKPSSSDRARRILNRRMTIANRFNRIVGSAFDPCDWVFVRIGASDQSP